MDNPPPGSLSWRLSSHPITLLFFLAFRLSSLLTYLLGLFFTSNFVLIFIVTILLLAMDFYYLKNIAGRRLVGLRWWNEVDPQSGDSHWVFESAGEERVINATDKRFFWLALYAQPVSWVALAVVAIVKFEFIWLTLVGTHIQSQTWLEREAAWITEIGHGQTANAIPVIAMVLTITNTLAFSRCDKFSQAANLTSGVFNTGNLARNVGGAMISRLFR
ncbi:Golgi apparatus membrane protein tvp23 [Elasticomyces elasticus]|nr:Golgi apparatus membrane protein tvp23 [Elasticomyces elasticus]KAK4993246.1 Golgi apparatus membrane protein tvp23 [Elasticomyces elasticus]KAK4993346.1 Golgi apparatus membrane protein tvp23 [Elasticomyces elasticus]